MAAYDTGNTTWYRERRAVWLADPVASLSSVRPSQRAERGGLHCSLRYVLIPWENQASTIRSDRPKRRGVA